MDRHFTVTNNASLRLIHLVLVNGRAVGVAGEEDGSGGMGAGGSIYSSGGALELIDCRLSGNQAEGGTGGEAQTGLTVGGSGYGGAVYVEGGTARLENCVLSTNSCAGAPAGRPIGERTFGGFGAGGTLYAGQRLDEPDRLGGFGDPRG